jgi:hypothetical protein
MPSNGSPDLSASGVKLRGSQRGLLQAGKGASMTEYWYNVNTHEVEEDALSDWSQLIGPYKTREEAEHALEKVRARNESWEKGDED